MALAALLGLSPSFVSPGVQGGNWAHYSRFSFVEVLYAGRMTVVLFLKSLHDGGWPEAAGFLAVAALTSGNKRG